MINKDYKETRKSFFHPKTNEYWIEEQIIESRVKFLGITLFKNKTEYSCNHSFEQKKTGFK